MSSPTFDEAATSEHRRIFPDRKCEVGNAGCSGPVHVHTVDGMGRQLCAGHSLRFEEEDHAGRGARLTAWVRAQRADVPPREG